MKIFQFFFGKVQFTVKPDLMTDLFHDLMCKNHIFITAFKSPGRLIVRKLMIDGLTHRKFVCVCFK